MRLQIASDLHHELAVPGSPMSRPVALADSDVDVLVLAGDVHNQLGAIDLYRDYPVPVVYVCGNHEFYDSEMARVLSDMRGKAALTSVYPLEKNELVLGGVRFLGTCM